MRRVDRLRFLGIHACLAIWMSLFPAIMPSAEPSQDLPDRVSTLVRQLDDDNFAVRNEARSHLSALASAEATRAETIRLLAARLADKSLTFDVREVLRALVPADVQPSARGPNRTSANSGAGFAPPPTDSELAEWFDGLESPAFDLREESARRLTAAAENPSACGPILEDILKSETSKKPSIEGRRRLQALWIVAWRTWLTSENPSWTPAERTDKQLAKLIERVVKDETRDVGRFRILESRAANPDRDILPNGLNDEEPASPLDVLPPASRELLMLLACDKYSAHVAAELKRRLDDPNIPAAAAGRLDEIYVWSRPAMVAEIWIEGRLGISLDGTRGGTVQHLIIGVPNQPSGAPFPSHFDACNEETAHCVSGNTLVPGDYPVGIFFQPPPREDGIMRRSEMLFHLVNLPTARRRLAYEVEVPIHPGSPEEADRIDASRRAAITHRTVDYMLKHLHLLNEREMDIFQYLDPVEAARFAEPYLMKVDDERYDPKSPQTFGNGSLHGWFCYTMTKLEAPEAGRAIAKAIDAERILPPTKEKPYRIDWAAALSLADRAPWPGCDEWLAAQLDRTEPLKIDEPAKADLGASAAAVLAKHHDVDPARFFLEPHTFPDIIDLECPSHRFVKPEGREAVKKWWTERK